MNEEMKNENQAEETVEEEIKEEGKFKKGLKTVWKYTKKAIPAVAAGVGCFVLGRVLDKGMTDKAEIEKTKMKLKSLALY